MRNIVNLGKIIRLRIRLHYTWALAFILITIIVVTQFPETYPLWRRISLGIMGSVFFFVLVSIREFILSFLAISRGIRVKGLIIFVFGGVPQIDRESTRPILELLLGAAGLLSNLLIAGVLYIVYLILVLTGSIMIAGLVQWLTFIYFLLALFHFIPAFPLDGGRILRALLWRTTGNYERVTRNVSWIGIGVGLLLTIGGISLLIVSGQWFVGMLLAPMGWVLYSAALQSRRQVVPSAALQGITAQDIMAREYHLVSQQLSLGQLVHDYILNTGQHYFVVVDDARCQGIVTTRNIRSIPKRRWSSTRIGEIMTPVGKLQVAHPQQSAASVLEQMDETRITHIPVLVEDKVIGIIDRDSLIRLIKTRAELRI